MTASRRDTTMNPVKLILSQWPTATDIRAEDDSCPNCDGTMLYSFVLPEYEGRYTSNRGGEDTVMESCGYVCCLCDWSNAGGRPVESEAQL